MKKAGIIIGVLIVFLALGIFIISNNIEKAKNKPQDTTTQEQVQEPVVTQTVEEPTVDVVENTVEATATPEPTVTPTPEPIITQTSAVTTFSEEDLGTPSYEKEEIVVIATKRVLLIDEGYGTAEGKMLTYCFDVLTPDNRKLVLFVTDSVYDQFIVEGKLKVIYKVYVNDKGVEFPIVSSVSAVD